MRAFRAAVVMVALTAPACTGEDASSVSNSATSSPSTSDAEISGLRPVEGYRDHCEGCGFHGEVPATLRRPLHLPEMEPGDRCPAPKPHPVHPSFSEALGNGPVFPILTPDQREMVFEYPPSERSVFFGSEWSGVKVLWVADPSYDGPVLVRGHQLDGPNPLGFEIGKVPFVEMQLHPLRGNLARGWANWSSTTRVRAPGCYAYQVDGTDFSLVIVFRAVVAER